MATNKITKSLYGGKVLIDFYPDSHRYKLQGEKTYLISATGMTGILDKSQFLLPWAINLTKSHLLKYLEGKGSITPEELYPIIDEACVQHTIKKEEAGDIGTQIHKWCEDFAHSKIHGTAEPEITEEMDERVLNGISAFLDFYNNHDVQFLESEKLSFSLSHGWVGINDILMYVDGKKTIGDFKTGKYIYDEQYFQLGQYWMSIDEENQFLKNSTMHGGDLEPIEQGLILHFNKETGEFTPGILTKEEHEKNIPTIISLFTIKSRLKELASKKPYVSQ